MICRLTRRAKADIKEIYRYTVRNFGTTQAELYLGGLDYTFDLLTDSPKLGKAVRNGIRRYRYKMHYVFYRLKDDQIIIVQIRNTRQKLPPDWEG